MAQVRYFLGSNSRHGFYSLYDEFMDPARANSYHIIKSGPGSGKSTLMRAVAARAEAAGHPVEYISCSGDPDSLDGIYLPACAAAVVDGTSPHVIEPKCAGAFDHYLTLGGYDREALMPLRGAILARSAAGGECYRRAYRCLSAAAEVGDDMRAILLTPALEARLVKRAKGIIARELRGKGSGGGVRQRFLGAITCQGQLCLFETAQTQCKRVYELQDNYGLGHLLLGELLTAAVAAGHEAVVCPNPLSPDRLEHLIFPGLSLAFLTSTNTLPYPGEPYRRLRIDAMADGELLRRNRARLRFSRKVTAALLDEAVESLAQAKRLHDELESIYNPHIRFQVLEKTAELLAEEILSYSQTYR